MSTTRRGFITTAVAAGLSSSFLPASFGAGAGAVRRVSAEVEARQAKLAEVLRQPVLKRELFKSPVIIKSVELLRWKKSYLCRVRSEDGAEGLSVGHKTMHLLHPIFLSNVQPFFIGKDARDLDQILEQIFIFAQNYRLNGISIGLPLATVEFAILDMLGRMADRSIGQLVGEIHNPEVGLYVATEGRELPYEENLEVIRKTVEEYDVKALKIRTGYTLYMSKELNPKVPEGKMERLIPKVRELYGKDMTLYADANGYWDVKNAIRIGKLLEENKYAYFEEPVAYDDFEAIKRVADELEIPIANGEQDHSYVNFSWLIANDGLEIVQPDNYYFGGMIRSVKVGRMAAAFGKSIIPHMTGGGLGFLYNCHIVSVLPNAGLHHEFKGLQTEVPFECKKGPLKLVNGKMPVPTGPGLGVEIDPEFVQKHTLIKA
jgi:L-alanine-DL-glutamate epimerase-like enolase superfamily enzyme